MKKRFVIILSWAIALPLFAQTPVYLNPAAPIEDRVEDALQRMTREEKVAMLHAQSKFSAPGVPRLGIPENWMSDGPHGIRAEVLWDEWYGANWTNDSCIAFPALTALAASWNPDMAALYGKSIGEEARYRNKNVLLGPGVNIYRTPLNGRNFEYMGEDPYLAAQMVVPYIKEVQRNGVAACVKHFALNNQEIYRNHINVQVSARALHEIYLPAFKAAIQQGGAWAIMGAYNQYKNQHCCHNRYLLNDILKRDWGFDGVVVSDWGGVHNTEEAIANGLDMEFGTWTNGLNWGKSDVYNQYYLAQPYLELLKNGQAGEDVLNDKVRRILRLVFRTNMAPNRPYGSFGTQAHAETGRRIAEEGIVLLQNNRNVLPVDLSKVKNILVVGENAVKKMTTGGGSSSLKVKYEVSPLAGIQARVGSVAQVTYVKGYESPAEGEQDVKNAKKPEAKTIDAKALRAEAVNAAKSADVVLFIGGLNKNAGQDCEGDDRKTLDLPYAQNELIAALAKANPNMVVVIISGNAVAMPWAVQAPAIVEAWYNGTEAGNAIAAVLFGDVNPSGKLPFTFPARLQDNSAHAAGDYPGDGKNVTYHDDIFVGYRWLDKEKIKPLFAFGHGLSYTMFQYGEVSVNKSKITAAETITFTLSVKNTGTRDGAEVVQLYISDKKASLPRPVKELKGFKKVYLKAGETQTVSFTIDHAALSFYDDAKGAWITEPGAFEALVGASSADIKTDVAFEIKR
ncbi:MAG: glycoside hydrolase family 3 C-terminal domain-containing protein [Prevotellaceae bacterium]|jgi:beta-glucosidase|nr:glycoside hydrolase family 3 C-terminal domain-containing protein [Prevotellaceae bacterium]